MNLIQLKTNLIGTMIILGYLVGFLTPHIPPKVFLFVIPQFF